MNISTVKELKSLQQSSKKLFKLKKLLIDSYLKI